MNANNVLSRALQRLIRFVKWTFYNVAQSTGPALNREAQAEERKHDKGIVEKEHGFTVTSQDSGTFLQQCPFPNKFINKMKQQLEMIYRYLDCSDCGNHSL